MSIEGRNSQGSSLASSPMSTSQDGRLDHLPSRCHFSIRIFRHVSLCPFLLTLSQPSKIISFTSNNDDEWHPKTVFKRWVEKQKRKGPTGIWTRDLSHSSILFWEQGDDSRSNNHTTRPLGRVVENLDLCIHMANVQITRYLWQPKRIKIKRMLTLVACCEKERAVDYVKE